MKTRRLTVAQAIVHYLARQFTQRDEARRRLIAGMWGIQGHGNVPGLGQAMQEYGAKVGMRFYRPQNEQAQVHLAAAFARHNDRLSTFACTASIGPGSTNMLTGAALATIDRLPVLLLPSDYFATRYPDPVLQQLEHPIEHDVSVNDAFRPVSRFFTRVSRPEQLLGALPEAMRILSDPAETGAVTIALPEDVQTEAFDWPEALFDEHVWWVPRPVPEPERVQTIAARIASAARPMIVAGGGVKYSGAGEELASFARRFGIPVTETQAGRGALPWDHPMNLGIVGALSGTGASELSATADVVLALGTRLSDFTTGSKTAFAEGATFIGINVAAMDAVKASAFPLVADARRALEALGDALAAAGYDGTADAYQKEVVGLKTGWDAVVDDLRRVRDPDSLGQGDVLAIANDVLGGNAVAINAAGSIPGDIAKLWRPTAPRAYHVEYGFSCMGYEIPAGIGVKLAEPDRKVVVFIGDGSYLMLNSEIVTAVAEGLDLMIVVVDNHGFQSIHGLQQSTGTPHFGLELRRRDEQGLLDGEVVPIDFAAHATSMGAHAVHVSSADALRDALEAASKNKGVQVVVVDVDPDKRVGTYDYGGWWDCPPAGTSSQPGVQKARQEYEEARRKQIVVRR